MQKKIDLIYLIRYSSLIHENELMDSDDKVQPFFFAHIVSVLQYGLHFATVLSGGIAKSNSLSFFYENNCLFSKAASEGTTKKRTSARELRFFISFLPVKFSVFLLFSFLFFLV